MLKDKVILITGGGSGIGEATARICAGYGAKLLVTDMNGETAAATADRVGKLGAQAISMKVDVTNESDVAAMVERAVGHFGRLDGAFNNAGVGCPQAPTAEQDIKQFRNVLEIDLIGVWYCMKYEILAMQKTGGGSIVSTASDAGLNGTPYLTPYAAAKAGLVNMTRTAAMEYGGADIRLNCVCPGPIDTPALRATVEKDGIDYSNIYGGMAMKRLGKPEEVAELTAWLLSTRASFITGQAISADGGFNASYM